MDIVKKDELIAALRLAIIKLESCDDSIIKNCKANTHNFDFEVVSTVITTFHLDFATIDNVDIFQSRLKSNKIRKIRENS